MRLSEKQRVFYSERSARAAAHDAHRDTLVTHEWRPIGGGLYVIRPSDTRECVCPSCNARRYRAVRRATEVV